MFDHRSQRANQGISGIDRSSSREVSGYRAGHLPSVRNPGVWARPGQRGKPAYGSGLAPGRLPPGRRWLAKFRWRPLPVAAGTQLGTSSGTVSEISASGEARRSQMQPRRRAELPEDGPDAVWRVATSGWRLIKPSRGRPCRDVDATSSLPLLSKLRPLISSLTMPCDVRSTVLQHRTVGGQVIHVVGLVRPVPERSVACRVERQTRLAGIDRQVEPAVGDFRAARRIDRDDLIGIRSSVNDVEVSAEWIVQPSGHVVVRRQDQRREDQAGGWDRPR